MPEDLNLSNSFSVATAVIALMLNAIQAIGIFVGVQRRTQRSRFSFLLFLCAFLFSCASIATNCLNGRPGVGVLFPFRLACFCYDLFAGLLAFSGSGFLLTFADPRRECVFLHRLLRVFLLLTTVLLILAHCFGWFFIIDENNQFQRASLFPLSLLFPALTLLLDAYVLAFRSQKLDRGERIVFWNCVILSAAGLVLQLYVQDAITVTILPVALLLIVFLAQKQRQMLRVQQELNLRLQSEVLLSQIQPHFMHNMLAAIADLCDTDPSKAKQTILLFSKYLQGVVQSLNSKQSVLFAEELVQVKRYLELMQIRFEDALRVEYQIECTGFSLPPMCLQPIVENAVLHGVRRNPGGRGTVSLCTAEAADCWRVTVSDSGPGLDRQAKPDRERIQIGLKNVEERLRLICGGSLELASEPGKGTTVTFRIPK